MELQPRDGSLGNFIGSRPASDEARSRCLGSEESEEELAAGDGSDERIRRS